MNDPQRTADIETLARMAARLAGRDPDEHVRMEFPDAAPFGGEMWRYDDFLKRAEAAYHALTAPQLATPPTRNRHHHSPFTEFHRSQSRRGEAKSGRSTP